MSADDRAAADPFEPPLRIRGARGAPIESLGDWLSLAPPAGRGKQWRAGRSARELACAWLRPGRPAMPEELAMLLVSHKATTHFAAGLAVPEARIALDDRRGNTRNADLLLHGIAAGGQTVVAGEGETGQPVRPPLGDARGGGRQAAAKPPPP